MKTVTRVIAIPAAVFILTFCCCEKETALFWPRDKIPYLLFNRAAAPITHVTWSTGNHTASPVPLGSIGPATYTKKLTGIVSNTVVSSVMKEALGDGVSVILIIGDGFGPSHLSLPSLARNDKGTSFEYIMKNGGCGYCLTFALNDVTTDSAAAATALACGMKTSRGSVGMDARGIKLPSVLDHAAKRGMKTGIVSDTRVTHATPACFYGHAAERGEEDGIALQLAYDNDIDVILGGGARYFIPKGSAARSHRLLKKIPIDGKSERNDGKDLVALMHEKGYAVASDKTALASLTGSGKKILGLFAAGHMNSRIDRDDEETGEPSVTDMARAALSNIGGGKRGFFLMIECGRLDYDAHYNDMGALIRGVMEMEEVTGLCLEYQKSRPAGTLLIFTGDHETGGPAFSYHTTGTVKSPSGALRKKGSSSLTMEGFNLFLRQKRSLRSIFSSAQSAEDLAEELEANVPFAVSRGKVKEIYSYIIKGHYGD